MSNPADPVVQMLRRLAATVQTALYHEDHDETVFDAWFRREINQLIDQAVSRPKVDAAAPGLLLKILVQSYISTAPEFDTWLSFRKAYVDTVNEQINVLERAMEAHGERIEAAIASGASNEELEALGREIADAMTTHPTIDDEVKAVIESMVNDVNSQQES